MAENNRTDRAVTRIIDSLFVIRRQASIKVWGKIKKIKIIGIKTEELPQFLSRLSTVISTLGLTYFGISDAVKTENWEGSLNTALCALSISLVPVIVL